MNAKVEASYDKNRQLLHKLIPLDTPFTIIVEPTSYCNLKCNCCMHTLSHDEMVKNGHVFNTMSRETFDLFVNQLREFPRPIKSIAFIGVGEPLLHKDLPYMIKQLKMYKVVERITLITNGVLLSKQLSSDLVSAGLDVIKISVNGMSEEDYQKNCGVKIDFDKYLSEIAWLYQNKGETAVYIKTMDTFLNGRSEYEFYNLYGNYCDKIMVEKTLRSHPGIDYDNIGVNAYTTSVYPDVSLTPEVCSLLFFAMYVGATGKVSLCCNPIYGHTGENFFIQQRSLMHLWNSKEHRQIMQNILQRKYEGVTAKCNKCPSRNNIAHKEDYLDPYADEIYARIFTE